MNRVVIHSALILGFLVALRPCHVSAAAATQAFDFDKSRQQYEESVSKIENDFKRNVTEQPQNYIESLGKLETSAKTKGDLSGLLAVKNERERFEKDRNVPPEVISEDCAPLKKLQIMYRGRLARFEDQKNEGVVKVSQQYMSMLEEEEKNLTRRGEIDLAIKVRDERQRVLSEPRLTRAEFELADAQTRSEPPETDREIAGGGIGAQPPTNGVTEKTAEEKWETVGGPGVRIYAAGEPPVKLASALPRDYPVVPTDYARGLQSVSADIDLVEQTLKNANRTTTRSALRLTLGTRTQNKVVTKPTVLVDYFIKSLGEQRILKARSDRIPIPNLTSTNKMIMDTLEVETITEVSGNGRNRTLYGRKFHGVVVSIFDGAGTLVYQGVYPATLKGEASPVMP